MKLVLLVTTGEGGNESLTHTVDIMLINLGLNLIIGQVVDLTNLLTRLNALSKFYIEQTEFTINRRTYLELILALTHQDHVTTHVLEIILHLIYLHRTIDAILLQALGDKRVFLGRELIVLLRLFIVFLTDEFFCIKAFVLLIGALLTLDVHIELSLLCLVVQLILSH